MVVYLIDIWLDVCIRKEYICYIIDVVHIGSHLRKPAYDYNFAVGNHNGIIVSEPLKTSAIQ